MEKDELKFDTIWKYFSDKVCYNCEIYILHCSKSSSTFQCEGRYCEEAMEYYITRCIDDDDLNKIKIDLRKEKITKIKNNIKYETK